MSWSSSSDGIRDLRRRVPPGELTISGSCKLGPENEPPRFLRVKRGELRPISGFSPAGSSIDFLNFRITIGEYCCLKPPSGSRLCTKPFWISDMILFITPPFSSALSPPPSALLPLMLWPFVEAAREFTDFDFFCSSSSRWARLFSCKSSWAFRLTFSVTACLNLVQKLAKDL